MQKLKYIIIDTGLDDMPIMGPHLFTHDQLIPRAYSPDRIISAGFVTISVGAADSPQNRELIIECFGNSISLDKKSRPEDAQIIRRFIVGKE